MWLVHPGGQIQTLKQQRVGNEGQKVWNHTDYCRDHLPNPPGPLFSVCFDFLIQIDNKDYYLKAHKLNLSALFYSTVVVNQ